MILFIEDDIMLSEKIKTEIIRSGDLIIDVVHNMIFKKGSEISIKGIGYRWNHLVQRGEFNE